MFTKYYHTLIHLKPIQIRYQLWYRIRRYWRKLIGFKYTLSLERNDYALVLKHFIQKYPSYNNFQFTFLNQSNCFTENYIDWNYKKFGKLWTYNLNYFDFLLQPELKLETGLMLIKDYISKLNNKSIGLEPYPTTLRCINWIKFISNTCHSYPHVLSNSQISEFSYSLYAQYQILLDNLEYHLLANHLLENGFSLLFGAFYFKDEKLYRKAIAIIRSELNEQILDDGAHFELSPMYHQILLDRLFDCINLVQNNQQFDDQESMLIFMIEKAKRMLQWINYMTFSNGQIPLLNDSAAGISPSTNQLNEYAIRLAVTSDESVRAIRQHSCNLNQSGYRRYNGANYECIVDIGFIGPSYQPGHAHADTFNFVLNVNNQSILIDPGVSTYEANQIRLEERGTASHNSVTIGKENSSKIWSSFRVAQRAEVKILEDSIDKITAKHNGFQNLQTIHQRHWNFHENEITIIDTLKGSQKNGTAHFLIPPEQIPEILCNSIKLDNCTIDFENSIEITMRKLKIPKGYNKYAESRKVEVTFSGYLSTTIKIFK